MKPDSTLSGSGTVGFVSLGCPKNRTDSEHMASLLWGGGVGLAAPDRAETLIVNTCAFVDEATEESLEAIRAACARKRRGDCRFVVVAGCLPQRRGRSLATRFPEVDAFVGIDELDAIVDVVRGLERGRRSARWTVSRRPVRILEPPARQARFAEGPFAYVKIAEGCNHRCSFCVIPALRGRYRSRPVESIVRQSERLLERGVRELVLVSQDTTAYGRDRTDGASLPGLLRAMGRLGGDFWIRLLYGHPAEVDGELLDTMGAVRQVCRYLDLPVQHSHPEVLRRMRRPGGGRLEGLPDRLRSALPGLALRTTCLVGFPGETPRHFAHLRDFLRAARFDHLGVFVFSPQEGTEAARAADRVSLRTARRRREELMLAQQETVAARALEQIGSEDRVLVEEPVPRRRGAWWGRAARSAPEVDDRVLVTGIPRGTGTGSFVRARYASVMGYDRGATFVSGTGLRSPARERAGP